ncbi:hypothetical protein GS632_13880 [Ruegeria sp. HKCCD7296]|nr:hypothetical protein [Ruegeria sp. HKCCD7296]
MRGVVSGAMSAALENLNLTNCFDAVYGASAGAMAGAFFVAGSARAGATIYYEEINNRQFVNPWRLALLRPIMDLDFLVYDVFQKKIPLDCEKIIQSPIPLNIVMTDVSTGSKRVVNNFGTGQEVLEYLKASASNPLFAPSPVVIGEVGYWDAILSESIPVRTALDDGCTHVVVLRSRPKLKTRSKMGAIERFLAKQIILPRSSAAFEAYCRKTEAYSSELELIDSLKDNCLTIAPSEGTKLSQASKIRADLLGAAKDGYSNALAAFGAADQTVSSMIGHY